MTRVQMREATALARRGLPHPDPVVQRAIVRYAHRRDQYQLLATTLGFVGLALGNMLRIVSPHTWVGALSLVALLAAMAAMVTGLVLIGRTSSSLRAIRINLMAAATSARPDQRRLEVRRSPFALAAVAVLLVCMAFMLATAYAWIRSFSGDQSPSGIALAGGVLLLIAFPLLVVIVVLTGSYRRVIAVIGADGIELRAARLVIPWADVDRVSVDVPGIGHGLMIHLREPRRYDSMRSLRRPDRWTALSSVRHGGGVILYQRLITQPLDEVLATAIALHRASLGVTA